MPNILEHMEQFPSTDNEHNDEEEKSGVEHLGSEVIYSCANCPFKTSSSSAYATHSENCSRKCQEQEYLGNKKISLREVHEGNPECDMYWNYKNGEFFMDAIFAITTNFEKFGDGLGCFIINKILLPIFHGLKHSNYSNSVHRFNTRILCEATPKEALLLIHEKFREIFESS